jgi:hypothetical protein
MLKLNQRVARLEEQLGARWDGHCQCRPVRLQVRWPDDEEEPVYCERCHGLAVVLRVIHDG